MTASIAWSDPSLVVDSDTSRRARYRLLQSWYRETVLNVPAGRNAAGRLLGSMLPKEVVEREPGLNFLDPGIASYVNRRIPIVQAADGTIEVDRLRRNMLSSMPLCFNLFGYFRLHPSETSRVLQRLLKLDIAAIECLEVEWAPDSDLHLRDRTAFDAFIAYRRSDGGRGFLGIETKYTEPFSQKEYNSETYRRLTADPVNGFRPGAASRLVSSKTNQLWRNVLLALSLRQAEGYDEGCVVVVSLADDQGARKAIAGLRQELLNPDDSLRSVSLEDLISACETEATLAEWAGEFNRRYLNLAPVQD